MFKHAAVTCTLLTDGSSDRVLLPIIRWLMDLHCGQEYRLIFARLVASGGHGLAARIEAASHQYPCHVLFVHRDAEREPPAYRHQEITDAWSSANRPSGIEIGLVTIVPVRMTEAWLLLDEVAVRHAAGNPNGRAALSLPSAERVEHLPDPKEVLFAALRMACELPAGRRRKFRPEAHLHRVPEMMTSFEALRALPSFRQLETQVQQLFAA